MNNIPISELNYIPNNSVFIYQLDLNTLSKCESIYEEFILNPSIDNLQILDNGKLIILENKYQGGSIISEFTCGLKFCFTMSKYLPDIENVNEFKLTVGSDDFHSGWDYDFILKFEGTSNNFIISYSFPKNAF